MSNLLFGISDCNDAFSCDKFFDHFSHSSTWTFLSWVIKCAML